MRYFVSGHRDLTKEEFEEHYVPLIQKVIKEDSWAEFVVGDWEGCDTLFIEYILYRFPNIFVSIYYIDYIKTKFRGNYVYNYDNINLCKRNTYDECDASMTRNSDFDIAWIRPGREDSHTAKNIKRRYNLQYANL